MVCHVDSSTEYISGNKTTSNDVYAHAILFFLRYTVYRIGNSSQGSEFESPPPHPLGIFSHSWRNSIRVLSLLISIIEKIIFFLTDVHSFVSFKPFLNFIIITQSH